MPLTVGGGVRTVEDVRALLLAGADKVSFNSAAVANAGGGQRGGEQVRRAVRRRGDRRQDRRARALGDLHPWRHAGRRGIDAVAFARDMAARGAGEILLTSMDRDGTQAGYNLALTRAVADAVAVPVIASGGVGAAARIWSRA